MSMYDLKNLMAEEQARAEARDRQALGALFTVLGFLGALILINLLGH